MANDFLDAALGRLAAAGLLPGSRHKELVRILPPLLDAAATISKSRPEIQFVVAVAPSHLVEEGPEPALPVDERPVAVERRGRDAGL